MNKTASIPRTLFTGIIHRALLLPVMILLMALPAWASPGSAVINNLRVGYNKEGVRVVLDMSGGAEYQVYSIDNSSRVYIDIFNARIASEYKAPIIKNDPLLQSITLRQHNMRQVQAEIQLKYGIPMDNINDFALENPHRVAVDLYRDYHSFIQFHVTDNIIWLQTERAANGLFTLINELYVNHKSPDVSVEIVLAQGKDNRETISSMVERTGAIAGINGGYFGGGQSLGLLVNEGKIVSRCVTTRPPRTAFAIDFDRNILMDRVLDRGDKIITIAGRTWLNVVVALGAGPRLIKNGMVNITANAEGLGTGGNDITRRTGRSAVGVNNKGALVFMTASGYRDNQKDGMKLPDLAEYMKSREVVDAMNLDGGGSTAMSVLGTLVSRPPLQGNWQRPVANGILFFDKNPIISPRYMGIAPEQVVLPADGKSNMPIQILVTDQKENPVPDKTPLSIASGLGLINKKYHYTGNGLVSLEMKSIRVPGNYSLKIDCGPVRKFLPVKIEAGPPAKIYTHSSPATAGKKDGKFIVKVLVCDNYENGLPRIPVKFEITSGKGNITSPNTFTRPNGEADTTASLTSDSAVVTVQVSNLEPVTVNLKK